MDWMQLRGIDDLRAVSRRDLEAYQADLVASGKYAMQTVHLKMRALRRLYGHLEKTGRILVNPASGFRLPKLDRTLPASILTTAEVTRLLSAPDVSKPRETRNRAILETMYSTGIRVGELCALDIADVDLNGGTVRINAGKGAKDRVVPLGKTASEWIQRYILTARQVQLGVQKNSRLFVGHCGASMTPSGIEMIVRERAKQAGIEKRVSPHTLRHTFATHMIAAGADISHVQRLLGHSCITTTQIYLRVVQQDVKEMHERCHPAEKDDLPNLPAEPARFSTAIAHCEVSHE